MFMFGRFTERAQQVLVLAQDEARRLNHNFIGTEHLLLGLVKEGAGIAARVLQNAGIDLNRLRQEVEKIIPKGEKTLSQSISYTPVSYTHLDVYKRQGEFSASGSLS